MDILYIVGNGSKHDNAELRYSLRSICKYGKNIGKVIVAGQPPEWLSDEVETLKVEDKYNYKHNNILNCIEHVVDANMVHGDFLYSSDDHFYIKEVDFDKYPFYIKSNHLRNNVEKTDAFYRYHASLVETGQLLRNNGFDDANFSQHCNTHMNADIIKSHKEMLHKSYEMPLGAEPTSLVMNIWKSIQPLYFIKRHDLKVSFADTMIELLIRIGERDCFSISDSVFNCKAVMQLFHTEYAHKCPLEKF